jgi:hypothetical protein
VRIRRYRKYIYETGALKHQAKMQSQVIDAKVVAKERKKKEVIEVIGTGK